MTENETGRIIEEENLRSYEIRLGIMIYLCQPTLAKSYDDKN